MTNIKEHIFGRILEGARHGMLCDFLPNLFFHDHEICSKNTLCFLPMFQEQINECISIFPYYNYTCLINEWIVNEMKNGKNTSINKHNNFCSNSKYTLSTQVYYHKAHLKFITQRICSIMLQIIPNIFLFSKQFLEYWSL